ncbi:MAG TPA: hypothetical protein VLE93_01705 [Candidatus Saccharimonadales bacterium]|nr:hypothetical protein [Candidatus Saccharimonadales bacterium]
MKTASAPDMTPATDGQYGEAKTMFERTLREAVATKNGVQNILGRWDKTGPLISPILTAYSLENLPDCELDGQEVRDFLAHPDSVNRFLKLVSGTAREFQLTKPLRERLPAFTLTFGRWKSKKDMIESVEGKGHIISDWAKGVINHKKFSLVQVPEVWEFVPGLVKEVTGHEQIVTTTQLWSARDALGLGFSNGPSESACAIWEVYTDQPMDEYRYVLTEPTPDARGSLSVLRAGRDSDGSYVGRGGAYPDAQWDPDARLWLCRKRQQVAP